MCLGAVRHSLSLKPRNFTVRVRVRRRFPGTRRACESPIVRQLIAPCHAADEAFYRRASRPTQAKASTADQYAVYLQWDSANFPLREHDNPVEYTIQIFMGNQPVLVRTRCVGLEHTVTSDTDLSQFVFGVCAVHELHGARSALGALLPHACSLLAGLYCSTI